MAYTMTEEHKSKIKAGREAARIRRIKSVDVESAAEVFSQSNEEVIARYGQTGSASGTGRDAAKIKREKIVKDEPVISVQDEVDEAPIRSRSSGRVEARGRDGEVLSRKRTHQGDIFALDPKLIPPGWEYQWAAVSVTGNTEILLDQNLMMAENGWRPVPCERYPGKFMPIGHKGSIIRGGQMLMERPAVLCEEARAEDVRNAKQLISDRNESLKLAKVKDSMQGGFEMSGKYRGTGGGIRMEIDKSLDVVNLPRPQHKVAGAND